MICEICNGLIEESAADSVERNRKEIYGGKRGERRKREGLQREGQRAGACGGIWRPATVGQRPDAGGRAVATVGQRGDRCVLRERNLENSYRGREEERREGEDDYGGAPGGCRAAPSVAGGRPCSLPSEENGRKL